MAVRTGYLHPCVRACLQQGHRNPPRSLRFMVAVERPLTFPHYRLMESFDLEFGFALLLLRTQWWRVEGL